MLEERQEIVRRLLADSRDKLDRLVQALLHEENIGEDVLVRVLGPRPDVRPRVPEGGPVASGPRLRVI